MRSSARRAVDVARANVPEGTWSVGLGLIVVSLAAWGFQIVAAKQLKPHEFNAVNSLWIIAFVITPGFFQPLEQEVARAIAHRRETGVGGGPVLWKATRLGAALVGVVALLVAGIAVFYPTGVHSLSNGVRDENLLVVALLLALVSYATAYLARGALSGNGRFAAYGLMHGTEGTVRLLAVVAIVFLGHATPGKFALALVLPPIVAVAVSLRGQHGLAKPGPDARYSELSNALAWLLASSVLAQALSYAPVLAAQLLAGPSPAEQKALAGFIAAMFLARVPLLMFLAVQAALLPKLSGHAAAGRDDDFRSGLLRLFVIMVGISFLGVIGALTMGKFVGNLLFPDKWTLSNGQLALLALGAGAYIMAFTLAQGLIALKAYSRLTACWAAGAAAFVIAMTFGTDIFVRAELAFVAGSVVSAVCISFVLVFALRTGSATVDDLVEAFKKDQLEF